MLFEIYKCELILLIMFVNKALNEGNFHDFDSPGERIHYRCRSKTYPLAVDRLKVPENKVRWNCLWPSYKPPVFTAVSTVGQFWADPDIEDTTFNPKWNCLDGPINRRSHTGVYQLSNGYPINPIGRTGLGGRGVLGRWGPNHAADSVVTRWKRDKNGELVNNPISGKRVLQLITIQKCNGEWGVPGGMINPGETVVAAGKREFFEEVLASELNTIKSFQIDKLHKFFNDGIEIYKGYVDDPRNTDNAWVETVAIHYHDTNELFNTLVLTAGDDACDVAWADVDRDLQLYSGHQKFMLKMTACLNAHY